MPSQYLTNFTADAFTAFRGSGSGSGTEPDEPDKPGKPPKPPKPRSTEEAKTQPAPAPVESQGEPPALTMEKKASPRRLPWASQTWRSLPPRRSSTSTVRTGGRRLVISHRPS